MKNPNQLIDTMKIEIAPFKWKKTRQGEALFIGKVKVGAVFHTVFVAKGDPKNIQANCFLSGIKGNLGKHENETQAKNRVENAVNHFFKLLAPEEDPETQEKIDRCVRLVLQEAEKKDKQGLLFNTKDTDHLDKVDNFDDSNGDFETVYSLISLYAEQVEDESLVNRAANSIRKALEENYPDHF